MEVSSCEQGTLCFGLCQNCYQMNYIKKQSEQETKYVAKGSMNSQVQTLSSDTSVTTEKHIN